MWQVSKLTCHTEFLFWRSCTLIHLASQVTVFSIISHLGHLPCRACYVHIVKAIFGEVGHMTWETVASVFKDTKDKRLKLYDQRLYLVMSRIWLPCFQGWSWHTAYREGKMSRVMKESWITSYKLVGDAILSIKAFKFLKY